MHYLKKWTGHISKHICRHISRHINKPASCIFLPNLSILPWIKKLFEKSVNLTPHPKVLENSKINQEWIRKILLVGHLVRFGQWRKPELLFSSPPYIYKYSLATPTQNQHFLKISHQWPLPTRKKKFLQINHHSQKTNILVNQSLYFPAHHKKKKK